MKLLELISRLENLQSQIIITSRDVIDQELKQIEEENKERITAGKDVSGNKIKFNGTRKGVENQSDPYTKSYKRKKGNAGGQTGFVDLTYPGGKYVNQIKAEREGNVIVTESKDSNEGKSDGLNEHYPGHIGLTDEQKDELLQRVAATIGEKVIKSLIQ